jgi:cation/acetate symporter
MPPLDSALGHPTTSAVVFFLAIVALTLAVTYWAARRTRSTRDFYAAGRSCPRFQNGLALAGDYMRRRRFSASPASSRLAATTA